VADAHGNYLFPVSMDLPIIQQVNGGGGSAKRRDLYRNLRSSGPEPGGGVERGFPLFCRDVS